MRSRADDAAEADLPLFRWMPLPRILQFPSARRRDLIATCARRMAELRPQKAEEHLQRLLEQQAGVQQRRGVAAEATAADVRALEMAIRVAYARYGRQSGGAA